VLDLISGRMGQVVGGFPERVTARILAGEKPLEGRPGDSLAPADFEAADSKIAQLMDGEPSRRETLSYLLYPQVFPQFAEHQKDFADTSVLPTPVFLYGMEPQEEIAIDIEPGKTLIIKFLTVSEPHADGTRTVFFELNGQPREVTVRDHALEPVEALSAKADPNNPKQIAANMPGMVVTVAVQAGDSVVRGQKLLTLEAMKMETTIAAESKAKVASVHITTGKQVEAGDLLITLQ
jgi:pyruvate carboxylase